MHYLAWSTQHHHNPEAAAVIPAQVQKTLRKQFIKRLLHVGKSLKPVKRQVSLFTIQGTVFTRVLELLIYEILASCLSTHVANPVMDLSHTGDSLLFSPLYYIDSHSIFSLLYTYLTCLPMRHSSIIWVGAPTKQLKQLLYEFDNWRSNFHS